MGSDLSEADYIRLLDALEKFLDADVASSPLSHASLFALRECSRRFHNRIEDAIRSRVDGIPDFLPEDIGTEGDDHGQA